MPEKYLIHYGIKGMKWGKRRFQNKDGSLTPAGRTRYGDDDSGSDYKPDPNANKFGNGTSGRENNSYPVFPSNSATGRGLVLRKYTSHHASWTEGEKHGGTHGSLPSDTRQRQNNDDRGSADNSNSSTSQYRAVPSYQYKLGVTGRQGTSISERRMRNSRSSRESNWIIKGENGEPVYTQRARFDSAKGRSALDSKNTLDTWGRTLDTHLPGAPAHWKDSMRLESRRVPTGVIVNGRRAESPLKMTMKAEKSDSGSGSSTGGGASSRRPKVYGDPDINRSSGGENKNSSASLTKRERREAPGSDTMERSQTISKKTESPKGGKPINPLEKLPDGSYRYVATDQGRIVFPQATTYRSNLGGGQAYIDQTTGKKYFVPYGEKEGTNQYSGKESPATSTPTGKANPERYGNFEQQRKDARVKAKQSRSKSSSLTTKAKQTISQATQQASQSVQKASDWLKKLFGKK